MATITSNASGAWATGATWVGGSAPADDDAVVIAAGHNILMDADLSAYTGLRTVTITGGATPGMLYFKDGTSGYLKIRTGYNLVGTTDTNRGRLLANSDGTWGNTGALAFANKAVIDLQGTSKIDCTNLDVALYCTLPTFRSVRTYGTKYDFTASGATVNTTDNTIDLGVTPPTAGTAVAITTAAGSLPAGLTEDTIYYVRGVSGTTCKLALQNSDDTVVDITSTGSGTCSIYTGHTSTSTAEMNVLDDVTGDACWTTTSDHNRVVLADSLQPDNYDQQRVTLSGITSSKITLSANVDSAQYPGARIYLSALNVSVRSTGSSSSQAIFDYVSATYTHSGVYQCEIVNTQGTGTTFYGYGVYYGSGHIISGSVSGCSYGVIYGSGHTISGTVTGCSYGVISGSGHIISGSVSGCSYGLRVTGFTAHGMTLSGNTTDVVYSGIDNGPLLRGRSFRHGGTANDTRAWSAGGAMTHETSEVPDGKSYSHKFTHVDAGFWTIMEWEITRVEALALSIAVHAKHDATSLTEDQRIHWQIVDPAADPLINGSNVPLASWIAADSTSWQSSTLTYNRTDDRPLLLRAVAKRASGNSYIYAEPMSSGGTTVVNGLSSWGY